MEISKKGEIKSVKVDNWGVFFLQKLQNFFNKTDYCDLTLQFNDNSQLKVHRLVLSACTDYFNVLEQSCEMIDDALVMPNELQADVVVPIVNFMYTGTLEFELHMYGRLLKTARDMNMTVLLKLLEAHRRTMEQGKKLAPVPSARGRPRRVEVKTPTRIVQRRVISSPSGQSTVYIKKEITSPEKGATYFQQPPTQSQIITKYTAMKHLKGPARYESDETHNMGNYEPSFDGVSYESRPLKDEPDDSEQQKPAVTISPRKNVKTSPFEQLRQGYKNNKRPASTAFESPPEKKPNIEDVKEYAEQQRMRKQIAAEYGDDQEYESILDDEFHNDDDDDEFVAPGPTAGPSTSGTQHQSTVTVKQENNHKPTIVVKDSTSSSRMNHAKIISEVLKKYPHLIKNNRNIKLKIMPQHGGGGSTTQRIVVKKEPMETVSGGRQQTHQARQVPGKLQQSLLRPTTASKPLTSPTATSLRAVPSTSKGLIASPPSASPAQATTSTPASTSTARPQAPRRIDSKTMHSLIALGAENTTGPWLCLRCGVNGRPISIPSYRGFRRHLINTHKEKIDARLCEHCGWRSANNRELHHHMLVEHKIASTAFIFPKCEYCEAILLNNESLKEHVAEAHAVSKKQQCIYCNASFAQETGLYDHMKARHKERAREDGVIDFSDEECAPTEKIKILSDISLPATMVPGGAGLVEEHENSEELKFVTADGNEMILTDEQRQQIMSQLDDSHASGVVMVLNEETSFEQEGDVDEADEEDDEMNEEATADTASEVDSTHEARDEHDNENESRVEADEEKKKRELDLKLKLLAGDWSDDDESEPEGEKEKKRTDDTEKSTTSEVDSKQETVRSETDCKENDEDELVKETTAAGATSEVDSVQETTKTESEHDEDEPVDDEADPEEEDEVKKSADDTGDSEMDWTPEKEEISENAEKEEEIEQIEGDKEPEKADKDESKEKEKKDDAKEVTKEDHKMDSEDDAELIFETTAFVKDSEAQKGEEKVKGKETEEDEKQEGEDDECPIEKELQKFEESLPETDEAQVDEASKTDRGADDKKDLEPDTVHLPKTSEANLDDLDQILAGDDEEIAEKKTEAEAEEDKPLTKESEPGKSEAEVAVNEDTSSSQDLRDDIEVLRSQLKTKDEIKNLISEWGDDDDEDL